MFSMAIKKTLDFAVDNVNNIGLYSPYPTHRGRCHEASCWRSGVRRPRLCLAHTGPGGLGQPSVPTTWGCLQWLEGEGRTRGEARGIRGVKSPPSDPGSAVPRTQTAAVERRKATRPAHGR